MSWPIEIAFPDRTLLEGRAFGEELVIDRTGSTATLRFGEDTWQVGLPRQTQQLRFGPSLGPLPFLLFPTPNLLVPAGTALTRSFTVPLHLDVAAVAERATRIRELEPPRLTRSLYGPVDFGTLCWTVRAIDDWEGDVALGDSEGVLLGDVKLTIENRVEAPHEVAKIMIPVEMVGLYSASDQLSLSDVRMTILGDTTAELTMDPPRAAKALPDVLGRPITPTRPTFLFSHHYRNRTGLDYGF